MFHDIYRYVCFTISLFISPKMDHYRAFFYDASYAKMFHDMFHDMFTICSFNSPDLDMFLHRVDSGICNKTVCLSLCLSAVWIEKRGLGASKGDITC
jgi:hypothetical protein